MNEKNYLKAHKRLLKIEERIKVLEKDFDAFTKKLTPKETIIATYYYMHKTRLNRVYRSRDRWTREIKKLEESGD